MTVGRLAALVVCGVIAGPHVDKRPSGGPDRARPVDWQPRSLSGLGLSVDLPAGAVVEQVAWKEGGGTIYGALQLGRDEAVRFALRTGRGEGLAAFRGEHAGPWRIQPVEAATACGRPAQRQRATLPAQELARVLVQPGTPGGNYPAHVPPRVALALAFEHRGLPVVLTAEIESARPRPIEAAWTRFFQSVRCQAVEMTDCQKRCEMIVLTRHDACGYHPGHVGWPDWCAADNERWRSDCEASCTSGTKRP